MNQLLYFMLVNIWKILNDLFDDLIHGKQNEFFFYRKKKTFLIFMIRTLTGYGLWRVIASLVPDMSKNFREAHYELARLTQVKIFLYINRSYSN